MTIWLLARYAGLLEPGQRVTVPKIARHLRSENPEDYGGEDETATIRRVYRLSVALTRADIDSGRAGRT